MCPSRPGIPHPPEDDTAYHGLLKLWDKTRLGAKAINSQAMCFLCFAYMYVTFILYFYSLVFFSPLESFGDAYRRNIGQI